MPINRQAKGKDAEREVANELNVALNGILVTLGVPLPQVPYIQRNQNQSAVGGKDLTGTFDLCIEIKRQETLSVNTWWAQCLAAARRNGEKPVLIYRQNRQAWAVVMEVGLLIPAVGEGCLESTLVTQATIPWNSFMQWFRRYAHVMVETGRLPKL